MPGIRAVGVAIGSLLLGLLDPAGGLKNPGFEEGAVGETPPGWSLTTRGFRVTVVEDGPKEGKRCVRVAPEGAAKPAGVGVLLQSIDAKPYRGKLVRLRSVARLEVMSPRLEARAQVWMRVDRSGGRRGFFDNMDDRPVRGNAWAVAEINGEVARDAERIFVGFLVLGGSTGLFDDVTMEVTGEAPTDRAEAARPIEGRGLENLVAFARLLGYVRHFHPSDQVAAADWDRFAVAGVLEAEAATDAADLARRLRALFGTGAPTVRIFPTGQAPPVAPDALTNAPAAPGSKVVSCERQGFGVGMSGPELPGDVYWSRIVNHPLEGGKRPVGVLDPAEAFAADLGGGVSCLVPLTLYADDRGTVPAVPSVLASPTVAGRLSGNDRATRLAAVALLWNVIQHFYPYFDVVEGDWSRALPTALASAAVDEDEAAFASTLRRMVAAFHDGHGHVNFPDELPKAPLPVDWDWAEGKLVVTEVAPGVKGEGPGGAIRRGDVVRSIDGRPAAEVLAEAERLISAATPQWARTNALGMIKLGNPGSSTTLEIEPLDGPARRVVLRRPAVSQPVKEGRPPKIHEIRPGLFYVDIDRVSDADLLEALARLEKANGIVFDFRGYPSGLTPDAIFSHLIDRPVGSPQWHVPLVKKPDRREMTFERMGEWKLTPRAPYFKAKRAFLVDGHAISYAESCLGIVEHEHLGAIVGAPTAGTNGNINSITLPGGYSVLFTGMKVLKHDGSRHHGVGILPTVPVSRTLKGIAEGKDELLEKAVEVVGGP